MANIATPAAARTAQQGRLHFFNALRYPNYRYYWFGLIATVFGQQVLWVSQGWLVYDLTHNTALLGVVAVANAVPQMALTAAAGVMADRVDRRRVLIFTQLTYGLVILALAVLISTGQIGRGNVELAVVYLVAAAFIGGAVQAFDQPARMALVPQLLDPKGEELLNAVALQNMVWQTTAIVGPAVGGLLIAWLNVAACYYITAFSVLGMVGALFRMRLLYQIPAARHQSMAQNFKEGVGFIRGNAVVSSLLGLIFFNSLFGLSFMTLIPAFARDVLQTDAAGQGFMMGAFGVGALIGNLALASLGRTNRTGAIVVWGALGFGIALVVFAVAQVYVLSVAALAALGLLRAMYMTTGSTALQTLVPNQLRGRVMGIYAITWGLVPLGGFLSGTVAALVSPGFAVGAGGVLVALFAVGVVVRAPNIRNLSLAKGRV